MRVGAVALALALTALLPSPGLAQEPASLVGTWDACFRATEPLAGTACGSMVLSPAMVCGPHRHGAYAVAFTAIQWADPSPPGLPRRAPPPDSAAFTWAVTPAGELEITRVAWADSVPYSGRCNESPGGGDFEARGRLAGDSIAGTWGQWDHYGGAATLGTFVLRPRREPR